MRLLPKLTLIFIITLALNAVAQDETPPDSAQMAEIAELYAATASPGPEHETLRKLEGTWRLEGKIYPAPGVDPMPMTGTTVNKMILGGRFLQCDFVSGEGPMKTDGLSILGFGRRKSVFTSVGFDSWGTYHVTGVGQANADASVITLYGEDEDQISKATQKYDLVYELVDSTSYRFAVIFYDDAHTKNGEPFKMVELSFKME